MQSISHFACHPQTLFTILRAKQHSQSFYFNFSPSNNTPLNPFIFINHIPTQQLIIQVSEEEIMETLVKQMRVRFSGIGLDDQEGINSNREKRIPPQKTQSFKGERKGAQNWFRRQFSWQMNQDNDADDGREFATAIAAAAFAITSLEEEGLRNQKKMNEGLENTLSSKSRKESRVGLPDPGRVSRRFTVKNTREDKQTPGEASEKPEMKMPKVVAIEEGKPEKIAIKAPSIKKTTTFADQTLNVTGKTKSGKKLDTRISDTKLAEGQTLSTMGEGKRTEQLPISGIAETQARAWEQAEMERIRQRYEKMNSTIVSWETEKKVKARRRLDRIESELEKRRARTLQHYRSDMSRIDKVAGGAKALAQERKRNEESKTKEKAKKIRSTGKVPVTCFCI